MLRIRLLQGLIAAAAIAASVALYLVIVPTTTTSYTPLRNLILATPGLKGFQTAPIFTGPIPTGEVQFPAVPSAAATSPAKTGVYVVEWTGPLRSPLYLEIQVYLQPTLATAMLAQTQIVSGRLSSTFIATTSKYHYDSAFSIPSLGASGTLYTIPGKHTKKTKTTPAINVAAEPGAATVVRVGRAIAYIVIQGPAATKANAIAVSKRQAALIEARVNDVPPFQFVVDPIRSSIVFGVVAFLLIVMLALIPPAAIAVQRRREAERVARLDRHRRVRGSKALRRQRARF